MQSSIQQHWDTIYKTKTPDQVSWTQKKPVTSLNFIHSFGSDKSKSIIDIGGGDSLLADFLLAEGYENITVLDISGQAISRAQNRLGDRAGKIQWIVSDILKFKPDTSYDIWHDRATFHFLTTNDQVTRYLSTAGRAVNGYMTIGTFSTTGPEKCSGLNIRQYSEDLLDATLNNYFDKIKCIREDHLTPFNTKQNFLFCSFKKSS